MEPSKQETQNISLSAENYHKTANLREMGDEIDVLVSKARAFADGRINRGSGGRELSLAITNLQQARQWCEEAARVIERGF